MNHHIKEVHTEKPMHACELCDYKYESKMNMNRHIKEVHTEKLIHACDECNFIHTDSLVHTIHSTQKSKWKRDFMLK